MSKKFSLKDKLTDNISFKIDKTNIKDIEKSLKDSTEKKALKITVDMSHGGYVNQNFRYYRPEDMREAVSSLTEPCGIPVQDGHWGPAIGRTISAQYVDLKPESPADPKCKIVATSIITDEATIEKIKNGTYLTVSSGAYPIKTPTCSICGKEYSDPDCFHSAGHEYDGKLCYIISNGLKYDEYSFVNTPADKDDKHVAGVVSMEIVDMPDKTKIQTTEENKDNKDTTTKLNDESGETNNGETVKKDPVQEPQTTTQEGGEQQTTETGKEGEKPEEGSTETAPAADPEPAPAEPQPTPEAGTTEPAPENAPQADNVNEEDSELVKALKASIAERETKISELEAQIKALQGEQEAKDEVITKLGKERDSLKQSFEVINDERRALMAKRILDLQIQLKNKEIVEKINNCASVEDTKKVTQELVDSYLERSTTSLSDTIRDLESQIPYNIKSLNLQIDETSKKEPKIKIKSSKINKLFNTNGIVIE